MEWLTVNSQINNNKFTSLGSLIGDKYVISEQCQKNLEDILNKLSLEDTTLHTFRRAIGFSQIIKKELLPLLINIKDDRQIISTTIRILSNLTTPVECLLPIDVMSKTDAGRNTIVELKWLLESCKEEFCDPRTTRSVVHHMKHIISKNQKLSGQDIETLNDCLNLLRNVLHINVTRLSGSGATQQNQILWNLFAQNIDKILIDLMSEHLKGEWRLTVVQLIALLYRDQHVPTLEKLLHQWFEASVLSESSEDNESNTSPPERGSGDSSSMITSDPTSDSSDNSGPDRNNENEFKGQKLSHNANKKTQNIIRKQNIKPTKKHEQQTDNKTNNNEDTAPSKGKNEESKMECISSEHSDCGYGTQVENQESVSSASSNDDNKPCRVTKPVHHKPTNKIYKIRYINGKTCLNPQEKEDVERKKLIRRSRANMINMKALLHHSPTDDDISHLLKEFTVDFLLKGYGFLVADLREQLLFNIQTQTFIDSSHFFWLVSYFLKFAVLMELDVEHISFVLSFDVISFITYEGVGLCEQFELAKFHSEYDMAPCLRKTHLVVTAIRELIQATNNYKKVKHLNNEDKSQLSKLQRYICESEDLRCLFVLLIRQFNPNIHSKQYLQDIIVTNHLLLSFIESCLSSNTTVNILQSHMKQFAAVEMMTQYGILLEGFDENGQYINDCIFTMMHHVAGDLEHVSALFQPNILKTFSRIWETDFELCDDWIDLVEYVIHKFINIPRGIPSLSEKHDSIKPRMSLSHANGWTQEDCDSLYWYYVQSANNVDPVGDVINLYSEGGVTNKTRIGVIEQLLKQDVITGNQYNELMKKEPISVTSSQSKQVEHFSQNKDEVEILKDHLVKDGKICFITWVQKILLEVCNAKLNIKKNRNKYLLEPVSYYCALLQEPTPIVAWSSEQCNIMQSQIFLLLLHKIGLHLPVDAGKVYARIPHCWTPDILYNLASKLGPLEQDWMKFNIEDISEIYHDEVNNQMENGTNFTVDDNNCPFPNENPAEL